MAVTQKYKPVFEAGEDQRITREPFTGSRKVYVQGSDPSIRVPMREIVLTATKTATGHEENPPLRVYDTSGPYTDPDAGINVHKGLSPLRLGWILARGDVQELERISSSYGREREDDPLLGPIRFRRTRKPLRAKAGACVTQMHYARRGIVTPEMEFIAIRENQCCEMVAEELRRQHPGTNFGANTPKAITPFRRQLPRYDRQHDNVVDAQHDLEQRQRNERGRVLRRKQFNHQSGPQSIGSVERTTPGQRRNSPARRALSPVEDKGYQTRTRAVLSRRRRF